MNILLLEPNYKNKYPPLGLMKISYYHKYIKNDHVFFSKRELSKTRDSTKWNRVYISTLFTFEWKETEKTIRYALRLVDANKIYVGGILATLMPELIRNLSGDINLIEGQLNRKGLLGYQDDDIIDTLTPDYGMLDDIRSYYEYPTENAYITYTTRGCGMKCGFCAVQKLEPKYIPRIGIAEQIRTIKSKYGEKRDLLLMDNNVLISKNLDEIVDEIKSLGYKKGEAFYINPKTGKRVKRIVDFNQGLDLFLLSEEKVKILSEIELVPARIAFDHIEDEDRYIEAIKICANHGMTEFSNYLLYNADSFSGKGKQYRADTPSDLYNRLDTTLNIKEELNKHKIKDEKISFFSFPMKYSPLDRTDREYIGPNWNAKYLRSVQTMLTPTQGKGVSSKGFFHAAFGRDLTEFLLLLEMPESVISARGHFVEINNEDSIIRNKRYELFQENQVIRDEWSKLYSELGTNLDYFRSIINSNKFTVDTLISVSNIEIIPILLHYYSESKILLFLSECASDLHISTIVDYYTNRFPLFLKRISRYVFENRSIPYAKVSAFFSAFGENGAVELLRLIIEQDYGNSIAICRLSEGQRRASLEYIDFDVISFVRLFVSQNALKKEETIKIHELLIMRDFDAIRTILRQHKEGFINTLRAFVKDNKDSDSLYEQLELAADLFLCDL